MIVCVTAKGFESSFNGIGYIMLCMAVLSYSLYCVSAEKAYKTTSIEKTYVMIACGACFFATMAIARSIAAGTVVDLFMLPFQNTVFLFSILYLGIASSVLSFVLFNISISSIGTNKASSFVGISTAVSVLAGVFILDENFSYAMLWNAHNTTRRLYSKYEKQIFLALAFFTFVKAYTRENGFASGTSDANVFYKEQRFL